jgi:hypothetical protein
MDNNEIEHEEVIETKGFKRKQVPKDHFKREVHAHAIAKLCLPLSDYERLCKIEIKQKVLM